MGDHLAKLGQTTSPKSIGALSVDLGIQSGHIVLTQSDPKSTSKNRSVHPLAAIKVMKTAKAKEAPKKVMKKAIKGMKGVRGFVAGRVLSF